MTSNNAATSGVFYLRALEQGRGDDPVRVGQVIIRGPLHEGPPIDPPRAASVAGGGFG